MPRFIYNISPETACGWVGGRGLAAYVSSVSLGHPKHCFFDSLDTQKFMSEFADDDFFLKIEDVGAVVSLS